MKLLTFLVGAIIVIAGGWLILSPQSDVEAPSFEEVVGENEESEKEGEVMEEVEEKKDQDHNGGAMEDPTSPAGFEGQEEAQGLPAASSEAAQSGDPIFHALVDYTDAGYSPGTVTIKKGETVRFVNNSSRGNWVGGNNHPSHTNYPEKSATDCLGTSFDTCRALQSGEFWEFTFNEVGTWGFHNHVRSRDGGSIVVQ